MGELFEDANKVRDELMNELLLLEKQKTKQANKRGHKQHKVIQEEDEEYDNNSSEYNISECNRANNRKQGGNMVSVGISRAESLMTLN